MTQRLACCLRVTEDGAFHPPFSSPSSPSMALARLRAYTTLLCASFFASRTHATPVVSPHHTFGAIHHNGASPYNNDRHTPILLVESLFVWFFLKTASAAEAARIALPNLLWECISDISCAYMSSPLQMSDKRYFMHSHTICPKSRRSALVQMTYHPTRPQVHSLKSTKSSLPIRNARSARVTATLQGQVIISGSTIRI